MDELESISQLLDNLHLKMNIATQRYVTHEQATTWKSKLHNVQRTVQNMQNDFVPINQLPNDILHLIFSLVLQEELEDLDFESDHTWSVDPEAKIRLKLTAVCRRWRHMAIENTLFWRKIHIFCVANSSPAGMFAIASEFLVRSKTAPLSVKITISGPYMDSDMLDTWMSKLSRESHRIEEFNACVGSGCITSEALDFSAPNLKTLSVLSLYGEPFPPVFKSQFPSLRKLSISRFISWPPGLFTNLTSLTLVNQLKEAMSPTKFLDVLQNNSTLKELIIDHHGPNREDACLGRLIHLPSLQFLLLDGCNHEFILTHISFPQSCKIRLYDPVYYLVSLPEFDSWEAMNILSGVPQEFLDKYVPQVIDSLTVEYSEDVFQVDAQHLDCSLTISHTLQENGLTQEISYISSFVRKSFSAIANCQAFNTASQLSISGDEIDDDDDDDLFSEQFWISWFSQLERLKQLKLQRMQLNDMFRALLKKDSQGNLPCEKLRFLEVEIEMDEVGAIEDLDSISYLVKGRYIKGLPLKYIKVRVDSALEKEGLEELWKKYVKEVHIEFFEPDYSTDESDDAADESDF